MCVHAMSIFDAPRTVFKLYILLYIENNLLTKPIIANRVYVMRCPSDRSSDILATILCTVPRGGKFMHGPHNSVTRWACYWPSTDTNWISVAAHPVANQITIGCGLSKLRTSTQFNFRSFIEVRDGRSIQIVAEVGRTGPKCDKLDDFR